ncbi:hypothetical protein Ddye_016810 [Dipteronia dyeriana]|uniref:HAT C-terminal dimerisation domain-containing protein n=1 Tax=Dipteronia dyeriana TaxID=168575 RepID=A0AAD9WZX6_9ROSI|nr:hypothetical protein Ddye_016810 [Dipteronia dyeriana]
MGYIYEAMDRAKEAIARSFGGNESKYEDIFKLIDARWNIQLHRPLNGAGWFLNPEFFYNTRNVDDEVANELYTCIERLVPDVETRCVIDLELSKYKNAEGLFGSPMGVRMRGKISPAEWWDSYGTSTPALQKIAIKILSLTCSSSGCEPVGVREPSYQFRAREASSSRVPQVRPMNQLLDEEESEEEIEGQDEGERLQQEELQEGIEGDDDLEFDFDA